LKPFVAYQEYARIMGTNGEAAARRALGAFECRFWMLQLALAV